MKPSILSPILLIFALGSRADILDARGMSHPGWSLSIGSAVTHLDLNEDQDKLFSSGPVKIDEVGRGGYLAVGYAFGNDFGLQLHLVGAEHATGDPDTHFASGQFDLEALAYLRSTGPLRPYLAGGFGGAAVVLEQPDGDEDVLVGGSVSMGGGLQAYLSRRWSLLFDYRFGIQNYEEEHFENDDVVTEREVDLSSTTHRMRFGVAFSF